MEAPDERQEKDGPDSCTEPWRGVSQVYLLPDRAPSSMKTHGRNDKPDSASGVAIYKCTRLPGLADKSDFTCEHV